LTNSKLVQAKTSHFHFGHLIWTDEPSKLIELTSFGKTGSIMITLVLDLACCLQVFQRLFCACTLEESNISNTLTQGFDLKVESEFRSIDQDHEFRARACGFE
jgi:hypothetical protein